MAEPCTRYEQCRRPRNTQGGRHGVEPIAERGTNAAFGGTERPARGVFHLATAFRSPFDYVNVATLIGARDECRFAAWSGFRWFRFSSWLCGSGFRLRLFEISEPFHVLGQLCDGNGFWT